MEEKELTGYPSIDKPWMKYYDISKLNYSFPKMTIYEYLLARTKGFEDEIALTYYGVEITYRELHQQIKKAANVLSRLGVSAGKRILYLMPNIPETAYLLYGGAFIGAVADYIDPRPDSLNSAISSRKVLSIFQDERIDYIVSLDQCYLAMLAPVEKELAALGVKEIILVSASDSMTVKGKINYLAEIENFNGPKALKQAIETNKHISQLVEKSIKESPIHLIRYIDLLKQNDEVNVIAADYAEDAIAAIVHTSGTSSPRPKPIPLTHDNMNSYVHQLGCAHMPMAKGDRVLHMLPYFAAYGLVGVVHSGLCYINNLIQIPEFQPSNFGKLIAKYRPQTIMGAPSWFMTLASDPALQHEDLSCLTFASCGGDSVDPVDERTLNDFLRVHKSRTMLTTGHGMSETCGCASFGAGQYYIPGSIGIPLPYTTYAVVDSETKELIRFSKDAEYIEGEIIISSKTVTPGILDGKVIVPHREYNGESYIFTRDIARMDRNGIMTFLSRSDRSFTRFDGYKIKPYEVERVIKEYPGVLHCVVSPHFDELKFGNISVADIVVSPELTDRSSQVEFVKGLVTSAFTNNENVSTRQIPSYFRFKKILPQTVNSKIDYRVLADEGLHGDEVEVVLDETNISVASIHIH